MTSQFVLHRASLLVAIGLFSPLCAVSTEAYPQAPPSAPAACHDSLPDLYQRLSPSIVLIRATSIDPYDPEHRMQRVSGSGVM